MGHFSDSHPTSLSARSQYLCLGLRGHFLAATPSCDAERSKYSLWTDSGIGPGLQGPRGALSPDPRAAGDDRSREVSAADDYRLR